MLLLLLGVDGNGLGIGSDSAWISMLIANAMYSFVFSAKACHSSSVKKITPKDTSLGAESNDSNLGQVGEGCDGYFPGYYYVDGYALFH